MTPSFILYMVACALWGGAVAYIFSDLPLMVQMGIAAFGSLVLYFIIAAEERFK
jgi:hypothetical protein